MSEQDLGVAAEQEDAAQADEQAAKAKRDYFKRMRKNVGRNSGYSDSYTPTLNRVARQGGAAVGSAANRVHTSLRDAFGDAGFLLFFMGLFWWLFEMGWFAWFNYLIPYTNETHMVVSFLFMCYAIIRFNKGKGVVVALFLTYWIVFLKLTLDWAIILIGVALLVLCSALWGKFIKKLPNNELFSAGMVGIFPAFLFFVSVGGIESISKFLGFPVPELLAQILVWTPYWAYYGLTKAEVKHWLVTFGYVFALLNVLALLGGGAYAGFIADEGDFDISDALQQRQDLLNGPDGGPAPLLLSLKKMSCRLSNVGNPNTEEICAKEVQEYIDEDKCSKDPNVDDVQACATQAQEIRVAEQKAAKGTTDNTLEPIRYEWDFNTKSIQETFPIMPTPKARGLFTISGLKQDALATFDCKWAGKGNEVIGRINAATTGREPQTGPAVRLLKDRTNKVQVTCEFDKSALGSGGDIQFGVLLSNLRTHTYLTRAFLGEVTEGEKEQLVEDISPTYFSSKSDVASKSPDEDLARVDFQFGALTPDNPYITAFDPVTMVTTIRDLGYKKGKRDGLLEVRGYSIDMDQYGLTFQGGEDCFGANNPKLKLENPVALSRVCDIILPDDLRELPSSQPFYVEVFEGYLEYDYYVSHDIRRIKIPLDQQENVSGVVS